MTKKTSVTASATFDQIPSPNQSRKSGASTTRGTAFNIVMYGSSTLAANGDRASAKPVVTPAAAPMTSPSSDSSSVTRRCGQSEPDATHAATRPAISLGRLKKNGSITPVAAPACHAPTTATPSATRQNATDTRLARAKHGGPRSGS